MDLTAERLLALGLLHDAELTQITWEASARLVRIGIDDIYSNTLGLPGYPGATPSVIQVTGVSDISLQLNPAEIGLRIFEATLVQLEEGSIRCEFRMSPYGSVTITGAAATLLNQVPKEGFQTS
jgi:hypothetical protein